VRGFRYNNLIAAPLGGVQGLALSRLRAGKAGVLAGTSRFAINFPGDSTMMGFGDSGVASPPSSNAYIDSRAHCLPVIVSGLLAAGGLPSRASGIFCDNNATTANWLSYDPRIGTLLTGWQAANDGAGFSGTSINQTGANTGAWSITVAENLDTCAILFQQGTGGGGTFTVNVDGGATLATVNSSGTQSAQVVVVTFAAATGHTINIARASGGAVRVYGAWGWLSTGYDVSCNNNGVSGAKASTLQVNTYTPKLAQMAATNLPQIPVLATIANFGVNDYLAQTTIGNASTPGTFMGDYQTNITSWKQYSDVILCTTFPQSSSLAIPQTTYNQAIISLGAANRCPVLDFYNLFGGSWTVANGRGWMYDATHPNQTGTVQAATMVANYLLAA